MVPSREREKGFSLVEISMVLSVLTVLGVVVVAPGIYKLIRDSEKIVASKTFQLLKTNVKLTMSMELINSQGCVLRDMK